jgi:zinc transport system substrate-binding protein
MKTRRFLPIAFYCLALSLVLLLINGAAAIAERPPIKIIVTVFPLQEFAREVSGSRADVTLLLPPGADVHTWQPRVSDIMKVSEADLFIYIGSNLEPWADDILRAAARPGLKILEAGKGIVESPSERTGRSREEADPHIWLDFSLDLILVDRIRAALSDWDPEDAELFQTQARDYKEKLGKLDREYREAFKNCRYHTFIFGGHAAFGYLARRYGLEQIALFGLSPDAAPTPKELAQIMEKASRLGIRTVFFEPNSSDRLARMIAENIGGDLRPLNPGHNLTRDEVKAGTTFLSLMGQNLESFKHGLGCR